MSLTVFKEPTLEEVLDEELGLSLFTKFEEEGFRGETIAFYSTVKTFEATESQEEKAKLADSIITNFVQLNSPMELNIEYRLREKYLAKPPAALLKSGVWAELVEVAITLMRTNSWPKFKKSSYWTLIFAVNHKNLRFQQDGFDLDLSYIGGKQIIAMAFPTEGFSANFHNPLHRVQAFFRNYHNKNYRVYNLCAEKSYPAGTFDSLVTFPCRENSPPTFQALVDCVADASTFLADSSHVTAFHCMTGKGRTGTVVASLLLHNKIAVDAAAALNLFGTQRTMNNKGVTIPSQQRYVRYYQAFLKRSQPVEPAPVTINGFVLTGCPLFDPVGGCDPYFKIFNFEGEKLFDSRKSQRVGTWQNSPSVELKCNFTVEGDFRVSFFDQDGSKKDGQMFSFALHTNFLRRGSYVFPKACLDGAALDKKHIVFPQDFTCEIKLELPDLSREEKDENNTPFAPAVVSKREDGEESSEDEEDGADKPKSREVRNAGRNVLRGLVSKQKFRYQEQGFDLDLTYITKHLIAMGLPATGREGVYRNALPDVQRFFSKVHAGDKVKVFNLCSERKHSADAFPQHVFYPCINHQPLPFKTLVDFCVDVRGFMEQKDGVCAVYCKNGKGRTGCAISSVLCMKECASASEALNFFGKKRTSNNQGVTGPSQQRYVHYFASYWQNYGSKGLPFDFEPEVTIKSFVMTHAPNFDVGGGCDPYFKIYVPGKKKAIFDLRKVQKIPEWRKELSREIVCNIPIKGDVLIMFFDEDAVGKNDKMFWLWLNTAFIKKNRYVFTKKHLEGAVKDKDHKSFDKNFSFEIIFEPSARVQEGTGQDENNTLFVPESTGEGSDEEEDDEAEGYSLKLLRTKSRKKQEFKEQPLGNKKSLVMTSVEGKFRQCADVKDRSSMLKKFPQTFVGKDTVTALVARGVCPDRESAVEFGNMVMQMGVFFHVSQEVNFKDENLFYRFTSSRRLLSLHQNFWNVRGSFKLVNIELGTHMSVVELPGNKYVVIDTLTLEPEVKQSLDTLTDRGKNIVAVLCVHPLHSLSLNAFYHMYPHAKYYGCPRHLEKFKNIQWAGDLQHASVRQQFEPHLLLSAPDGIDMEEGHRASTILVFHPASGIMHVNDLFQYFVDPPLVLRMTGVKPGVLGFHAKVLSVPLLYDPIAFLLWLKKILDEWDIQIICAAHGGNKVGGGKQALADLVKDSEEKLVKLATEIAKGRPARNLSTNDVMLCG